MAALEFTFTLHLSEDGRFEEMLSDLTATVLRQAGCSERSIAAVTADLRTGVATGRRRGLGCDVEFRAHGDEIAIAVSQAGRSVYRKSHRLPE